MKTHFVLVALNPASGDVENWIIPTENDKSGMDVSISFMESKYKKPVEVYSFERVLTFSWNWGLYTTEQKTHWVNSNLNYMVYSTENGFTEYGKSLFVEPIYDEE
ncbi:hypothetical protein ASswx1_378 [Aeromonas phage Asswx_1]|uniref:Uncharacterized protein n=1 Tax=Aeromonas phage Asswx_1 TaxID=2419739 RepID=A0A411B8U9_9CAUD|nr:hypothetical protein ASswx1_378 [Aeromonas phage Asswx_1]